MSRTPQPWKDAATLIIAARTKQTVVNNLKSPKIGKYDTQSNSRNFDYKLLMLQRSSESKFMPNAHVFPGGVFSENDLSDKWHDMFCKVMNVKTETDLSAVHLGLIPNLDIPRPFNIYNFNNTYKSKLPAEVAFRLCSIRETFEESGILLCTSEKNAKRYINQLNEFYMKPNQTIVQPEESDFVRIDKKILQEWRQRVNKDDSQFVEMCSEFGVVPNIWSLYEWSNWLTPTNMSSMHSGRRYDTAMFLSCLPGVLDHAQDDKEIVSSKWINPIDILLEYRQGLLWLPPPQIYEIYRLCNAMQVDSLHMFAAERSRYGSSVTFPVRITTSDGICSVLPGDEHYPEKPDFLGTKESRSVDLSLQEFTDSTVRQNRMNMKGLYNCQVVCNTQQDCHQLCPSTGQRLADNIAMEQGIKTNPHTPDSKDDLVP